MHTKKFILKAWKIPPLDTNKLNIDANMQVNALTLVGFILTAFSKKFNSNDPLVEKKNRQFS